MAGAELSWNGQKGGIPLSDAVATSLGVAGAPVQKQASVGLSSRARRASGEPSGAGAAEKEADDDDDCTPLPDPGDCLVMES